MVCRFLIVIPLLAAALSGCQQPGGQPSGAREGYFTWVDEQGQVRQTRIPGSESSGDDDQDSSGSWTRTEAPESGPHPEFNLRNFPDGNALEERGYVRPGDPEPYFTWRDAQGEVRVSYYRADTRSAVEKGEIKPPLQLTEASVYQAGAQNADNSLPEGADPFAPAVLGLGEDNAPFFKRWKDACCENLDRSDYVEWEIGREFGVNVQESALAHDFITGSSRYRLVQLPHTQDTHGGEASRATEVKDFILRLRSFNRKGMFVPSVAFLDSEFRPVRLVTDLVADYVPETWSRHGYLRSHIPVFPSRGERWLLIYTTAQDLGEQTVIETRYGPRAIDHQPTGELGLEKVEN
jgi:hypothetical protein